MRSAEFGRAAFASSALAVMLAAPTAAEDLVSTSYRLRGLHVSSAGPAWLTSTAPSPTISAAGVSVGQPEAIGYRLASTSLAASWPGFWPIVVGDFPNHDLDGDSIPSLIDLDDDGDGAPDATEVSAGGPGTDPLDPDSDNDGLCDGPPSGLTACAQGGEDLNGNGAYDVGVEPDPNDPDTDDDGRNDRKDLLAGTSPVDADSDNDGLCDGPNSALPACAQGGEDTDNDGHYDVGSETDPNNSDTDADGRSDLEDLLAGTSPIDADSDNDGLCDGAPSVLLAACVAGGEDLNGDGDYDVGSEPDPNDPDTDDDGRDDRKDLLAGTSPVDADSDNDGLCDGAPSALLAACVAGGEDLNGDGDYDVGLEPDPNNSDTDADGRSDLGDLLAGTSPIDADSDNDGLCDGAPSVLLAACVAGGEDLNGDGDYDVGSETDPNNPDTDADGRTDGAEIQAGTGPLDPDSDDDGSNDGEEVLAGTNPLDSDSDNDGLCDGAPSALPACMQGGEDLDGDGVYDVAVETDPNDPDTDSDGWGDGVEVLAQTNPLDPGSHPGLPPGPPAVPALQTLGFWLLTGLMGLLGITRLRKRSKA